MPSFSGNAHALQLYTAGYLLLVAMLQVGLADRDNSCSSTICVAPSSRASPSNNSRELNSVHNIQCMLACIQQYGMSTEVLENYAAWPTISFTSLEENCSLYQKMQQCTSGCITRLRNPALNTNDCREECYSNCREGSCGEAMSCVPHNKVSCERRCRKTYCRLGCQQVYDILTAAATERGQAESLLAPDSAPVLSPIQDSMQFTTNITQAVPEVNSSLETMPTVSFLFRVTAPQTNHTSFFWQRDLQSPLNLSAYACHEVSVAFAVVGIYGVSEYSPETEFCVPGVMGRPAQVDSNSVQVHYTEDTRPGFLGYSVANITWERPQGYQFITSYTIRIYTDSEECGGSDTLYAYNYIDKDATSFVVSAPRPNGLLKFGCSYTLAIQVYPSTENDPGTYKLIAPALPSPSPSLNVQCSKLWDHRGYFNISVTWTLPNSSLLIEAINRFIVSPTLRDTRYRGVWGLLRLYDSLAVQPQDNQIHYTIIVPHFVPQHQDSRKYTIEIRTERKAEYFWRLVPRTHSCSIDSRSQPPTPVLNTTIKNLDFDALDSNQLHFRLEWSPPAKANGHLQEYELHIGTEPLELQTHSQGVHGESVYNRTFSANITSAFVNITVDINDSIHCLFLQMRAHNGFLPGNWSDPVTLPRHEECGSYETSPNRRISVYFEDGENSTKILEVDCSGTHDHRTGDSASFRTKLQSLEEKLDAVSGQVDELMTASSLEDKLARLEQKINSIVNLLETHVHG